MRKIRRQTKTDAAIESIQEADAVGVFGDDEEAFFSDEKEVLPADLSSDHKLNVDKQGLLTTKRPKRN